MRTALVILLAVACTQGGDTGDIDTGDSDTGDSDTGDIDTGDIDTGDSDTGDIDTGDSDTGDIDNVEPLAGFGSISGDCGPFDATEIVSASPFVFTTAIDLPSGFSDDLLSDGGQYMVNEGNLNQSSLYSEVFSYEILYRCEDAALLLTEAEVSYINPNGKKTDLVIDVDGFRLGMSVVRAVGYPRADPWGVDRAQTLLEGKLSDILVSSDNVSPAQAWEKQILHVVSYAPEHTASLEQAIPLVSDDIRADTIIWITTTNGEDGFIYGD